MTVRWMLDSDRPAVVALMEATLPSRFDYSDMSGDCVIDEAADGQIRGMALILLARPYTWIAELCVAPGHRKGLVLSNLVTAILAAAKAYGSQGIQGFKLATAPDWIGFSREHGTQVADGVRVTRMIDDPVVEKLLARRQRSA